MNRIDDRVENPCDGQPAGHYLDKAKTMFEEMDLQWDLEEYRKFISKQEAT